LSNVRLLARLDIKAPNLIKGVHLEGLRVVGDPHAYAERYYEQGIDEIIYMDIVASLYGRNSLGDLVRQTAQNVFVPMTVGGGIRTLDDFHESLLAGADKVAINTAAVADPTIIDRASRRFGSQCVVLSIEAKRRGQEVWEVYTDNGREKTGRDVAEWAREAVERGAGEILLTSVDREGTRKGFDVELVDAVASAVAVPVIASGGMGSVDHVIEVVREGHADAVAVAGILHWGHMTVEEIRAGVRAAGIEMRP
jgi:imidazole glycerol-phosphate synthase subunit HisF